MPDFSIPVSLLKKPFDDLYTKSTKALQSKIDDIRTQSKVKKLHTKLWRIQRIKTIWNTDRPLSLSSIYYPAWVKIASSGVIKKVSSIEDLGANVIIYETAGQGKSMLMKYLVGREIRSGKRVPLLFELRNKTEKGLEEDLSLAFEALLDVKNYGDIFKAFADDGKFSFLLDGFDEIDPESIQTLMRQIDQISFKYPKCKILITSRPNSDCKNLVSFSTATICPLTQENFIPFFKKITGDDNLASQIVDSIEKSPHKIKELVSTPLLATLLAISYRTAHKIPAEFSEFYEELFQVLLIRHDGSKAGWRRKRSSGLADRPIQQTFEAFSFLSRRKKTLSMGKEVAYQLASEGIERSGTSPSSPEAFISDIKNITCLLIEEGNKIHFVHASVAQFFSAKFIKGLSEIASEKFYKQLLEKWMFWIEEIKFLSQIDPHRSAKYFFIEDANKLTSHVKNYGGVSGEGWIENYLSKMLVRKSTAEGSKKRYLAVNNHSEGLYCAGDLDALIFRNLFQSPPKDSKHWTVAFSEDNPEEEKTYLEIAQRCEGSMWRALTTTMTSYMTTLDKRTKAMQLKVKKNDEDHDFIVI